MPGVLSVSLSCPATHFLSSFRSRSAALIPASRRARFSGGCLAIASSTDNSPSGVTMPEAFVSEKSITRGVLRAVKAGKLRKLASRLYTRNMTDPPEEIVACNLWGIVAGYFPGALIADRTALENAPASDGSICLVTESGRDISRAGHTLRPRRGAGPLPTDRPFLGEFFLSSTPRACL